ncbi:hypothetical protein BDB00DRAFT_927094 [Zychaea mexicana]|uniref:uncharacterized protein n=1 Tax=Zychaea mexicana TaxID=64656 RepID=UPI0022FE4FEE|nr:uncharacterized protein BDB00DRAFT_927094 [Zychaea mexicana]KAI9496046.1 hypothetical protein BDB00DRAFT_927094 [Zychaea mexicana]
MPAPDAPPTYELQQQPEQPQSQSSQQQQPQKLRGYTPAAVLNYIINNLRIDDHAPCNHSLISFQEPAQTDDDSSNNNSNDQIEKENLPPPSAITEQPGEKIPQFLCLNCHAVITIEPNAVELRDTCLAEGYSTHHFHENSATQFECCGCHYGVEFSIQAPPIPLAVLHSLTDERSIFRTSVEAARGDRSPTVIDALILLQTYVCGLLKGSRRDINANNAHFRTRIGVDQASQSVLAAIGFTYDEQSLHFKSPTDGSPALERQRLLLCYGQLLAMCYELRQEVPATAGTDQYYDAVNSVQHADLEARTALGANNFLEPGVPSNTNPKVVASYGALGTVPGAQDDLVIWLYRKMVEEQPNQVGFAMDALVAVAESRSSETLLTEVAIERSQGRLGENEVKDAYTYFGYNDDPKNADDRLLAGLYDVKVSDEPNDQATHRMKLGIIAEARNSEVLHDLLRGPNSGKLQLGDTPVGLNNIGNTCYLNSLLQYYFTLTPFRRAILHVDDYVENEDDPEWSPKKIGGIEVDQKEVYRAKKFVFLLKDLFTNLENASQRAISPEYDLAYMALLNGRSVENDAPADTKGESSSGSSKKEPEQGKAAELQVEKQDESESQQQSADLDTEMTEAQVPGTQEQKQQQPEEVEKEELSPTTPAPVSKTADTPGSSEPLPQVPDNDNINEAVKEEIETAPQPQPDELPPAYEDVIMEDERPSIPDKKHLLDKPLPKPLPGTPPALPPRDPRPSAANIMFGKQQDVTECMGNVMYLVEAALKPLEKKENGEQIRDIVRDLFYGKARQILTYEDTETSKQVRKVQEEDFSHVIVDAAEGKDLYDGLDEYFFADRVEDFHAGRGAMREVTVSTFPPILQIQVQRVQFDRTTVNVYKSNAFVKFDKMLYLDRYCEYNFEQLAVRRTQVTGWRKELESNQSVIHKLTDTKTYPMPIPELLEAASSILEEHIKDSDDAATNEEDVAKYKQALELLRQNEREIREKIHISQANIQELQQKIHGQYDDLKQVAYRLHAVFIHQGQANYGHYWIYIYNHQKEQWWKYNDSRVTKVEESEILQNTTGSTANPYFLVYIKDSDADELVQTSVPNSDENSGAEQQGEEQQQPMEEVS